MKEIFQFFGGIKCKLEKQRKLFCGAVHLESLFVSKIYSLKCWQSTQIVCDAIGYGPICVKTDDFFSKTLNPNKQLVLNVYPYYSTTLLYFSSLKQCSPEKIIIKNFFFQLIMRLNFIYSPFHLLHHHQQIMINPFSVLALILSSFCFVSIQTQPKKTTAQKPDSHYCHCTLFSYLPPSSLCPAKNIF